MASIFVKLDADSNTLQKMPKQHNNKSRKNQEHWNIK